MDEDPFVFQDVRDFAIRIENVAELDKMIAAWTINHNSADLNRMLKASDIPATVAYTAAEIAADKQLRMRGMVRDVADPLFGNVLHAGIVPHVPDDPGAIRWTGPPIGAPNSSLIDADCNNTQVAPGP